jgi:hypothetical protein
MKIDTDQKNSSRKGFVLIIVVTLAMVLSLLAATFLRTARQTLKTVQMWEKYDHSLLAVQSVIDAQRYKLDREFVSNIATSDIIRMSDLYALSNEVATGNYDLAPCTMADEFDHVEEFPYADEVEVWVDVEVCSNVDETNEYVDISILSSATLDTMTRQFREIIRFQTQRSLFRYGLFSPEELILDNRNDLTINGDIRSNRGVRFIDSPGELVLNGQVVSSRIVQFGTNSLDYSSFPTQFDPLEYINPLKNSGMDVSNTNYPFGFCRPVVDTTNVTYGYVRQSPTNSRIETEFELVMPHIDTAQLKTEVSGTLTNGSRPVRTKDWNDQTWAPFPDGDEARNEFFTNVFEYSFLYQVMGLDERPAWYPPEGEKLYRIIKNSVRYWPDEVFVRVVSNYYGGTGTWAVTNPATGWSGVATNAKGPDSLYLDYLEIYTNLQDRGCLHICGSLDDPFVINGEIVVEKDVYIEGFYTGQGSIYAGRNIYIIDDLIATNPPVWTYDASYTPTAFSNKMTQMLQKDFLGLFAEGSIIIHYGANLNPWEGGDGEFSENFKEQAVYFPYRTLATNTYQVDYISGEPHFHGDFTQTDGNLRVKAEPGLILSPRVIEDGYDFINRWPEVRDHYESRYPTNGITDFNGEPCSYLQPLVSSNAYMSYIRERTRAGRGTWDNAGFWTPGGPRWDPVSIRQIDAVLYTENLMGQILEGKRFNGGVYYRKDGFAASAGKIRFGNLGLRGDATIGTAVAGSVNWDCRLTDPAFNRFLPLSGIESSIQQWAELNPTNQPPAP